MRWAFLDRWESVLRIEGIARGDRNVATSRVSSAFSDAGASILDVHFFSGVRTVLGFEVTPDRVPALREALLAAGLELGDPSLRAMNAAERAEGDGEIAGTLAITFPDGDADLAREVPEVPG